MIKSRNSSLCSISSSSSSTSTSTSNHRNLQVTNNNEKNVVKDVVKNDDTKSKFKWQNIVAGAAAGAASRLCSAPFDLIKIRRQLDIKSGGGRSVSNNNLSLVSSMKNIVKSEGGFKGLFRGNVAAMYLWISYAVVQFSLYERTSQFITSFNNYDSFNNKISATNTGNRIELLFSKPKDIAQSIACSPVATAFVAGGTAGVAATLVSYPFDTCRTIFASKAKNPPKSLIDYTSRMLQQNNVRGLYAGILPAVVQIIPYMGINFALYEKLVNTIDDHDNNDKKAINPAMAGFISGGSSKLLVYPLDTIKKRLQAQAFQTTMSDNLSSNLKYKGMIDCFVTIAKEEGIGAFYRGLVPTVLKSMVGTSVVFGVYSFTKNALENDDKTTIRQ